MNNVHNSFSVTIRILAIVLCAALSVLVVAVVVVTIKSRFVFPFELERMEGAFVDHARVVAQGGSVYAPPSSEFVSFIYAPLSYLAAAPLIAKGVSPFGAARTVSLVGIVGGILVGMLLVVRTTGKRWLALAVPVLAAAHYFHVDLYYDEARPDNLMIFFWMLSLAAFSLRRESIAIPLFVTFGTLTVFTKQTSLILFAVFLLGSVILWPRRALVSAVALFTTVGLAFLLVNQETHGWFYKYLIIEPGYHSFVKRQALNAVVYDLLGTFGVTSFAALIAAVVVIRHRLSLLNAAAASDRTRAILLLATLAGLVFSAASSSQVLVVRNIYITYAITGAAFLPVALDWAVTSVRDAQWRNWAVTGAMVVIALVAGLGVKDPTLFRPTVEDQLPWLKLRETLRSLGPAERAWVVRHGDVWGAKDSPMHVHEVGLFELVGGSYGPPTGFPMPPDLLDKINSGWFSAIVVADADERITTLIQHRYAANLSLGEFRYGNFSRGRKTEPEHIWTPRN